MKIIIDIPENDYNLACNYPDALISCYAHYIKNGKHFPKGEWLRMSDLSEKDDNRYKCSRCGNIIHHKSRMDLYTFNSWCDRCGSDNSRHTTTEEDAPTVIEKDKSTMIGDVLNNYDWSSYLQMWSLQMWHCTSEEDLYQKLQKFKSEFNSAYGKLSRKERKRDGFKYRDDGS